MKIVEINGLTKQYGSYKAVNNLSFDVNEGEMIGFLGVNGAGKSTTINMLSTILKPDGGEVLIDGFRLGKDDKKIRENIGVVYQQNVLDERLSVKENISVRAGMAGVSKEKLRKRLGEIGELLELDDILDKRYKVLSGGQKRRCEIAAALIHSPKILFLDEPTTGLDPATRIDVWKAVESLRTNKNMTVFLTTHYMEEAATADKIVIIDKGVKLAEGTPFELKEKYARDRLKLYFSKEKEESVIRNIEGRDFHLRSYGADVIIENSFEALEIIERLRKTSGKIRAAGGIKAAGEGRVPDGAGVIEGFEVIAGNMDDVFINVTKENQ